jgi:endonuclease/exonuclease/phosphatase family metal-dependent hydrolase
MRRQLIAVICGLACGGPLAACRDSDDPALADAAGPADAGYPAPRDDLVPPVGTEGVVDLATWNIENFPKDGRTTELVADMVTSMRLDLIAIQEVEDTDAWDELVARLPEHDGVLSTHTYGDGSYQKIGYLYRPSVVTVTADELLFTDRTYILPRPPLAITARTGDLTFELIALHLKAGTDAEDRSRRDQAIELLEGYVRDRVDRGVEDEIVILGDFNEVVTSFEGRQVMGPWLDAPDSYTVQTRALADGGAATFLPSGRVIDHIVTTAALADDLAGDAVIPQLQQNAIGYEQVISDHLPVVIGVTAP